MIYRPIIYRWNIEGDLDSFEALKKAKSIVVHDTIKAQLLDLMLCRHPALNKAEVESAHLVDEFLESIGASDKQYGNWIFYPWKNLAMRVLPEEEFIEVRTNRNKYKITQEEQERLRTKIVGIVGLSVGRAIATTIALERIAGEIRLADFDEIELSNLNRIKVSLAELGENKAISAAREIAELDPYIKITCFADGLTDANMDAFFTAEGKLDLFIEECDDIGIKIKSRLKCKELGIPVIMETNDNCIIDIERFDLEPERPIFHGKLNEEDIEPSIAAKTMQEKVAVLSKLLDIQNVSQELLFSLPEMGKTIRSWPQLGTDVTYGAGVVSSLVREMILKKKCNSGQLIYKLQHK